MEEMGFQIRLQEGKGIKDEKQEKMEKSKIQNGHYCPSQEVKKKEKKKRILP